MGFFIVFLGGGLGAALRHGVNAASVHLFGIKYPVGTFLINLSGSLLIGVVAELFTLKSSLPPTLRLFLITGILGGFTTFSAFSLEIGLLYERGALAAALIYALASVAGGVAAMFAGMYLVRHIIAV